MKVAVLGAGAWGTAVACALAPRHQVHLWARDPSQAAALGAQRENLRYLPGFPLPASIAVGADPGTALDGADLLVIATPTGALRVYSTDDVIGVEVGGAVKNVLAIATGIADALGLGMNARAALITRGLAEITRLGVALGARAETFTGLTGVGDLILTCTGDLSRNRRIGLMLGQGRRLDEALAELGHVAEGVWSAPAVAGRAAALGVQMPITEAVCAVLDGRLGPREALQRLLAREPRSENEAISPGKALS